MQPEEVTPSVSPTTRSKAGKSTRAGVGSFPDSPLKDKRLGVVGRKRVTPPGSGPTDVDSDMEAHLKKSKVPHSRESSAGSGTSSFSGAVEGTRPSKKRILNRGQAGRRGHTDRTGKGTPGDLNWDAEDSCEEDQEEDLLSPGRHGSDGVEQRRPTLTSQEIIDNVVDKYGILSLPGLVRNGTLHPEIPTDVTKARTSPSGPSGECKFLHVSHAEIKGIEGIHLDLHKFVSARFEEMKKCYETKMHILSSEIRVLKRQFEDVSGMLPSKGSTPWARKKR